MSRTYLGKAIYEPHESPPAIIMPRPFVIPTKEGSHLRTITLFDSSLFFSTFCLDVKIAAKKWRTAQTTPRVCPASAQQHSKALIMLNQQDSLKCTVAFIRS
jgi:hypothetical protein